MPSDPEGVVDGTLDGVSFVDSTTPATSDEYVINDFDDVDVWIRVTDDDSLTVTAVTVYAEYAAFLSPASTDWGQLQSDDEIMDGTVNLGNYLPEQTIVQPHPPTKTYHWNFPARGAKVRFRVFANATAASSDYSLFVKRNVRN